MSSVKWWRVVDPLNPLCGCDVMLAPTDVGIVKFEDGSGGPLYGTVVGLRRLDVLVGDRPFQLINPAGDLGVMVHIAHLVESPIQDDVVEIAYDLPHGRCLDEQTFEGVDEELHVVTYERAVQVAYGAPEGELYATATFRGDDRAGRVTELIKAFSGESGQFNREDICAMMVRENH